MHPTSQTQSQVPKAFPLPWQRKSRDSTSLRTEKIFQTASQGLVGAARLSRTQDKQAFLGCP